MLVTVYVPHSGLKANDVEVQVGFSTDLAKFTTANWSTALFYIAGDINSKVGLCEQNETLIGRHSKDEEI